MTDTLRRHLMRLLESEQSRYPLAHLQDYYKLVYQSVFGMEHLVADDRSFRRYLKEEYDAIAPDGSLPLFYPITLIDPIGRLHLKRCKSAGIPPDRISEICLRSCHEQRRDPEIDFPRVISIFCDLLGNSPFWFDTHTISEFLRHLQVMRFPAVHHSDEYREAYDPHYRLISPKYVDILAEFIMTG